MSVDGTDVVYKDIIEPLESASVTISKTDKQSITEFGNPLEVSRALCKVSPSHFLPPVHHTVSASQHITCLVLAIIAALGHVMHAWLASDSAVHHNTVRCL